jgi:hypothetical protein
MQGNGLNGFRKNKKKPLIIKVTISGYYYDLTEFLSLLTRSFCLPILSSMILLCVFFAIQFLHTFCSCIDFFNLGVNISLTLRILRLYFLNYILLNHYFQKCSVTFYRCSDYQLIIYNS